MCQTIGPVRGIVDVSPKHGHHIGVVTGASLPAQSYHTAYIRQQINFVYSLAPDPRILVEMWPMVTLIHCEQPTLGMAYQALSVGRYQGFCVVYQVPDL